MSAREVNFDGLIGPTHNYSGLSFGNVASQSNKGGLARPRDAALQGIAKMRRLMDAGLGQGVLPPQERPDVTWLRGLGFSGSDAEVWSHAFAEEQGLARQAMAVSSMWAANAATISPSADCADGRLHASVANLSTMLHRALEAETTERALRRIFSDKDRFVVHGPLTGHPALSDEGAANHMRLCADQGEAGVEVFVYGREAAEQWDGRFPARQSLEASRAVARRHRLHEARTIFVRQSRMAIEAGAFHNDVVAVSYGPCLFAHEQAFEDRASVEAALTKACSQAGFAPAFVTVPADAVPLVDAVTSYLFNAQLLAMPGQSGLTLIAPTEAQDNPRTGAYLERLVTDGGPIGAVVFVDVRESMRNGGGPACLRLRVALNEAEERACAGFLLTPSLADALEAWVRQHYRETLSPSDLADPALIDEGRAALDALTRILPLGSDFYPFQRA